jgi:hypothetical protein
VQTPGGALENRYAVRGTLEQVDCMGQEARLAVVSATGKMTLLIKDPASVQIRSSQSGAAQFTCGAQSHTPVLIQYVTDKQTDATGVVRSIEFLEK